MTTSRTIAAVALLALLGISGWAMQASARNCSTTCSSYGNSSNCQTYCY